jgi:hypothetical protein
MNTPLLREAAITMIAGIWLWILFRSLYGFALHKGRAEGYYFITVYSWLSVICGRPLPENKVEVSLMIGQIGSLLLSIIWVPMFWFGISHSQRITLYTGLLLSTLALPIAIQVIRKFVHR